MMSLLVPALLVGLCPYRADVSDMDALVRTRFDQFGVPGGAFAIVRQGRLVHAKGFGYSDPRNQVAFRPTTLCRIASISKCITGVAILALIQDGKLTLDTKLFGVLSFEENVLAPAKADSRLRDITIRQLLWQRSGLEGERHPVWACKSTAEAIGTKLPMNGPDLAKFALMKPLVANPGSEYHYANVNFFLLSRVIQTITGSYSQYVKKRVLEPCGILDMDTVSVRPSDRKPTETLYFEQSGKTFESVLSGEKNILRSGAYGGGGDYGALGDMWIASVVDLAKFLRGTFYTNRVLGPTMRRLIPSLYPGTRPSAKYCGAAFDIERRETENGPIFTYGHGGEMSGACGFIIGRFDDAFFIVLSNASNDSAKGELEKWPAMGLIQPLHNLADKVYEWPTYDLLDN